MNLQKFIQEAQDDFDASILRDLQRAASAVIISNILNGQEDADLEQWLTFDDDEIRKIARERHEYLQSRFSRSKHRRDDRNNA